jgi:hypothetical protein
MKRPDAARAAVPAQQGLLHCSTSVAGWIAGREIAVPCRGRRAADPDTTAEPVAGKEVCRFDPMGGSKGAEGPRQRRSPRARLWRPSDLSRGPLETAHEIGAVDVLAEQENVADRTIRSDHDKARDGRLLTVDDPFNLLTERAEHLGGPSLEEPVSVGPPHDDAQERLCGADDLWISEKLRELTALEARAWSSGFCAR